MVFHISRTLNRRRIGRSFKLSEDLSVGLSGDVGQHVESSAVRHSDVDLVEFIGRGVLNNFVEQRNHRLGTLKRESLLPDVLGLEEGFKGFRLVELVENSQLLVVRGLFVGLFDLLLEPRALLRVLQVCVFNSDCPTVGIAHEPEDFAKQHGATTRETSDDKLAIEIPEGEPVVFDFKVGVTPLTVFKRVNVGHPVSAHAERVHQLLNPGGLVDGVSIVDTDILRPSDRCVGDAKCSEDVFVEVVFADEKFVNDFEELTGACTLNDAVVVGRGERDCLGDAEVEEHLF